MDDKLLTQAFQSRRRGGVGNVCRFHVSFNIPKRLTPTKKQRYLCLYAF